jgi:hypothetical protein
VGVLVTGELAESGDQQQSLWLMLPLAGVAWGTFLLLLLRFGVLAAITAVWTSNMLRVPALMYAPGSWAGSNVYVVVPLLLLIAVVAFRNAIGGHAGMRRYLTGDVSTSTPA